MRIVLLLGALLLSPAIGRAAVLVITHPETDFDDKNQAGARTQELLASPGFSRKLVLMVYSDRNRYTFDPDAPGVSFERVVSGGGELPQDLHETDFVVGGGFISACMQDTVTDLIRHSNARRIRYDLGAVYATVSQEGFPKPLGGPRNMKEFLAVRPRDAVALFARIGERVYGSLRSGGLGDRAIELKVKGTSIGVVDETTYSNATPGDGAAMPRLRPANTGRPAFAVIDFD